MEERRKLRMATYRRYSKWDGKKFWYPCPWCGEPVEKDSFDLHEAIVKRSAVPKDRQHLIFVPENVICLHHSPCHMEHGNTKEMKRRCLPVMIRAIGAPRIGEWYVSLWKEHGLSVPRGILLGKREIPVYRCLELMRTGARLSDILDDVAHAIAMLSDGDWEIKAKGKSWDFRALASLSWMGSRRRGWRKPPEEYAGVPLGILKDCLDTGYWSTYLAGVSGFTIEELLSDTTRL